MSCSSIPDIPHHSIQISIDRGGTFTDVHASWPSSDSDSGERQEWVVKLLSQDAAYPDAPREGIRRVLQHVLNQNIPRNQKLNTHKIDYIRLSTTVATNALLERRGARHALLITKGFQDLLAIGNQSRPRIFDLAIQKPSTLYDRVVQVDERVTLVGYTSDPHHHQRQPQFDQNGKFLKPYQLNDHNHISDILRGSSGEAIRIIKHLDQNEIRRQLIELKEDGFESLAVVLMHSYTFPEHEQQISKIAEELGFKHVSLSSKLMPMIKLVTRGTSSTADAYLTPILRTYIDGFYAGFDDSLKQQDNQQGENSGRRATRVEFMRSDGGLTDLDNFSGLHSILSGPAGGVVGYALTTYDPKNKVPIIGLDMGGTSTDVSRYDGRYETVFETTTAGITIQSPQLDINTVAAGGGSRLFWRNGLFVTGPESAGATPGPTCYRKGGPLAVTDANLILGRLIPKYFPKIFGPNEDLPLDLDATRDKFLQLQKEVNRDLDHHLSLDQVAWGFIKIANETMCRPIRALTEARGYDTSKHILSIFGGAGGQHGCSIAKTLNIKRMIIHKHSSILSAYGMALADRVIESQTPSATVYHHDGPNRTSLENSLDALQLRVTNQLLSHGFEPHRIRVERYLNLRYDGTDTALMILDHSDRDVGVDQKDKDSVSLFDYYEAFQDSYRQEFGFLLDDKEVLCDDIRVRGIGKSYDKLGETITEQLEKINLKHADLDQELEGEASTTEKHSVYFEEGRIDTPIYQINRFKTGDYLFGPVILLDRLKTQTIIVDPNVKVTFLKLHLVIDL